MSKPVRLVGTFHPVPGTAGFVLPIFRAETSDMHMVQVIDHKGFVSALVHEDVSPMDNLYNQDVWTGVGSPAVYAVRRPNGGLEAGTREHLAQVLPQPIESGEFDATPVTRFRLSAFLRLGTRQATDALAAWKWVGETSSHWAAENWKVEGTIVPEFRRRIEFCLMDAGESEEAVRRICRGIEVNVDDQGCLALSVVVPGDGAEATRCREILDKAADTLTGEAPTWWPELIGNLPKVVIPLPPVSPEPVRLPVWLIFAHKDRPWADWIESTLAGAGYKVNPSPKGLDEAMQRWGEPTHILPLLSEQSAPSEWLRSELSALEGRKVCPVRVQDVVSLPILRDRQVTDLWGILEEQAELRLLGAVGGPAPGWTFSPPANRPPFPGAQTIHNLPPRPKFIGREKELEALSDWMVWGAKNDGVRAVIAGMPGVGKTALAIEAAYRNLGRFRAVWWIRGGRVKEDLAEIAERLDFHAPDQVVLAEFSAMWLLDRQKCLLVFDGVQDLDELDLFDFGANAALITSRRASVLNKAYVISLRGLLSTESKLLLESGEGKSNKVIRKLVRDLGGHPAALIAASESVSANANTRLHFFRRRALKGFVQRLTRYIYSINSVCDGSVDYLKMISLFGDNVIPPNLWEGVPCGGDTHNCIRHLIDAGVMAASGSINIRLLKPINGLMQQIMNDNEKSERLLELVDYCYDEFCYDNEDMGYINAPENVVRCMESLVVEAANTIPLEGRIAKLSSRIVESMLFYGRYSRALKLANFAVKKCGWSLFNMDAVATLHLASGRAILASGLYAESYAVLSQAADFARKAELQAVAAEASVWAGVALLKADQEDEGRLSDRYASARMMLEMFGSHCRLESTRILGNEIIRVLDRNIHGMSTSPSDVLSRGAPPDEADSIWIFRLVGRQCFLYGDLKRARVLFEAARKLANQIWGGTHPELAESLADLSEVQFAMGDGEEGVRHAVMAFGIAIRKLGRKHPLTGRILRVARDSGRAMSTAFDNEDDDGLPFEIEGVPDNDP